MDAIVASVSRIPQNISKPASRPLETSLKTAVNVSENAVRGIAIAAENNGKYYYVHARGQPLDFSELLLKIQKIYVIPNTYQ